MQEVIYWSQGDLKFTPGQCALASRLNDSRNMCNELGSLTCKRCHYQIGGTISGLTSGETVSLELTIEADNNAYIYPSVKFNGDSFSFPYEVVDGASFSVALLGQDVSGDKVCTISNESGVVDGAEVTTVAVQCDCLDPNQLCEEGEESWFRGLLPAVPIKDVCDFFFSSCGIDYFWWGYRPGPPNDGMCEGRRPICKYQENCSIPGAATDPDGGCTLCEDQCQVSAAITTTVLAAPSLRVDPIVDSPPGVVKVSGWAGGPVPAHGVQFFLDQEQVQVDDLVTGTYRDEVCEGRSGDCDSFSGFEGQLDISGLSAGTHKFVALTFGGDPYYPVPEIVQIEFTVEESCTQGGAQSVTIVKPGDGEIVTNIVLAEAHAEPNLGTSRVRFLLNGVHQFSDWSAPFEWTWATLEHADGLYTLSAEAVSNCGGKVKSDPVSVIVSNDHAAPILELESPLPWTQVSGTTEVSGWAMDADGVGSLDLRLNGIQVSTVGPAESRPRPEICSALGGSDPRCPNVGWAVQLDSTTFPDGVYQLEVVVTDGRGKSSNRSHPVEISNQPPSTPGVSAPASRIVMVGNSVSFEVTAYGEGPFDYRWQERAGTRWLDLYDGARDGRISGAGTSVLSIASIDHGDAGGYRCRVTNAGGASNSPSASLTVIDQVDPPAVTAGIDQAVTVGDPAELRVSAQGQGPLTYRWQFLSGGAWIDLHDSVSTSGSTTNSLSIYSTALDDAGYYRCRVTNPGGTTTSDSIRLTVDEDPSGTCVVDAYTLCLQQNRFQVNVSIAGGLAPAIHWSELGGFFRRTNPENVEVAVKVLNGLSINGRYWVFHGSLTDFSYTVTVTDTITGQAKDYFKPSGTFCGEADTSAFGDSTSTVGGTLVPLGPASVTEASTFCQGSTTAACLLGGRFKVEVLQFGSAQRASTLSSLSASFSFGSSANPEVLAKVLDGTVVNDWYWVFFGSLTHQDYLVRVTDTATGAVKEYPSPGGSCGMADTAAF